MVTLVSGGLSLVAALAWNDAIRSLFDRLFGTERGGLLAKFLYAAVVTLIVVFLTVRLLKMARNSDQSGPSDNTESG